MASKDAARGAGNRLLAALPEEDRARLQRHLVEVPLERGACLVEPGGRIGHLHFPESGMLSLVVALGGSASVEVANVGREGAVGLPLLLGVETSFARVEVQIPGAALRLARDRLHEALGGSAAATALLLRYAQSLADQTAQCAACNAHHPVLRRLARWLLTADDRIGGGPLPLTQTSLAAMLGVRRVGVTLAVGVLKKGGLIRGTHGRIVIVDRSALEGVACECYGVLREHDRRLVG